jgi:hypothetical protein
MKLVVSVLAAALTAATAASAAPTGFKAMPRLAAPVSSIAGKPVTAYCAPTQAAINQTVSPTATNILGATPTIGGSEIYLSPLVCANLIAWQKGSHRIVLYSFALSIETLAHEAELAAGISDETTATCKAIPKIPRLIAKFFPLRKRESLHDLMGDVHYFWMSQSPVYHAHPC